MNILLINAFFMPLQELRDLLADKSDTRSPFFTWPLAALSLAAFARKRHPHYTFHILDANKELHAYMGQKGAPLNVEAFISRILASVTRAPRVVGISINISTGHSTSLMLARAVKERWPDAVTVAGGIHVTNYARPFIEDRAIDYIIRGAAELSFSDFLASIEHGKDPAGIPGVITSLSESNAIAPPLSSYDEVPMLAYDLVDVDYYAVKGSRNPTKHMDTRSISYQFSRGCAFHCSFCVGSTVHGKKVLRRSNDLVLSELSYFKEHYGINTIIVEDDLFGLDKGKFYEFIDKLRELHLGLRFSFPNALSVAVVDEKMIDALVEIGLDNAILAVESGSPYVQKNIIHKNCNLPKALRLSQYLRAKGIPVMAYFILGFPGESVTMMQETISFAREMHLDWAYFFIAAPLMGSAMCKELMDRGVISEVQMIDIMDNTRFSKRLYDTPEISAADIESLAYDANISINFFENFNMRVGNYERAAGQFADILANYPFHVPAMICRAKCLYALGDTGGAGDVIKHCLTMTQTHSEAKRLFHRYRKHVETILRAMPEYASLMEKEGPVQS